MRGICQDIDCKAVEVLRPYRFFGWYKLMLCDRCIAKRTIEQVRKARPRFITSKN